MKRHTRPRTLPSDLVEQINAEYALVLFDDGVVSVVWRDPDSGRIHLDPSGIAARFAPRGFGRRLRWLWLADERRKTFEKLAAGTRFLSDEEWCR